MRESAAELPALRAELASLHESAAAVEALRRDHAGALERLEALRGQQEQVRTWLDEARRERDEFRAAGERTVAQVEELRRSLEEREADPAIPPPRPSSWVARSTPSAAPSRRCACAWPS